MELIAPADLYVSPLGQSVRAGQTIEVEDESVAESLRALGWQSPEAPPEPPRAPEKPSK